MTEPIVALRLVRNLKYKLTYMRIFEDYLETASGAEFVDLLRTLIQTQQASIAALSSYLRHLDANLLDLELNDKLLVQAAGRTDTKSRLRFIYDGLQRAVGWYHMQLVDKQMGSDPELRRLLIELGEMEAAKLWRTEAVMGILKIPTRAREKEYEAEAGPDLAQQEVWKPRLVDDYSRPTWGERPPRSSRPGKPRRR